VSSSDDAPQDVSGQDDPSQDDPGRDDRVLDLALRIGEMLLSNGAGAADVVATMSSVTHRLGLRQAQVDVNFTTLSISHQYRPDEPSRTVSRCVTWRETDFDDLTKVDLLVNDLLTDAISLDEARSRLAQIASTGHRSPRWAITLSWAVTGGAIAVLLGGEPAEAAVAALSAALIELLQRRMVRFRLPSFYGQLAGGLVASLIAVACEATDLPVDGSFVVISGIVMLLAGLGLIGAFQDALTGFYVTANARILEVLISTVGIIAGVGGGLTLGHRFDVYSLESVTVADLASPPLAATAGAATAAAFAFSAYAPRRSLLPIAVVSGLATLVYAVIAQQPVSPAWPAAVAALLVGLTGYGVAKRIGVPPLVIVVAGIVPLLPGLSIYRGLTLLADDNLLGLVAMITALASAIALASGVILGEYVAQPLRREARRLEQRLAGPRLVGPLLARTARPRRRRRPPEP